MAVPELYHYGREGYWFNLRSFGIYMIDGVYQASLSLTLGSLFNLSTVCYHLLLHTFHLPVPDVP